MSAPYFAWKHQYTESIFQSNFFDPEYRGGLFETKTAAFEAFREYLGEPHVCESIQDNFTLVEVRPLDLTPQDLSDCPNCPWGRLPPSDAGGTCDECGSRPDGDCRT